MSISVWLAPSITCIAACVRPTRPPLDSAFGFMIRDSEVGALTRIASLTRIPHYAMRTMQCNAHYAMHSMQCTLCSAHYAMQCTL